MKTRFSGKVFMFAAFILVSKSAFAGSVCTSYWPWGTCATWETTSELSDGGGSGGGSSGPDHNEIHFKNNCNRKIQTAIHTQDLNNNWVTAGWWTLNPGQTALVSNTHNMNFFVYGETADGGNQLTWGGTDFSNRVQNTGNVHGFRRVQTSPTQFQTFTYSFNCN